MSERRRRYEEYLASQQRGSSAGSQASQQQRWEGGGLSHSQSLSASQADVRARPTGTEGWLAQYAGMSGERKAAVLSTLLEVDEVAYETAAGVVAPDIELRIRNEMPPPLVGPGGGGGGGRGEEGVEEEAAQAAAELERTQSSLTAARARLARTKKDIERAQAKLDALSRQAEEAEGRVADAKQRALELEQDQQDQQDQSSPNTVLNSSSPRKSKPSKDKSSKDKSSKDTKDKDKGKTKSKSKDKAKSKAKDKAKTKPKSKSKEKGKESRTVTKSSSTTRGGTVSPRKGMASPRRPPGAVGFSLNVVAVAAKPGVKGMVIEEFLPKSGLAAAGAIPGDRIVNVGGFVTMSRTDLAVAAKNASRSGEAFTVRVVRAHEPLDLEVRPRGARKPGRRPTEDTRLRLADPERPAREKSGMGIVIKESSTKGGLYVSQVAEGSPYELAGGKRKDVIVAVGTKAVKTKKAIAIVLRDAGKAVLTMRIKRGGNPMVLFPDMRDPEELKMATTSLGATKSFQDRADEDEEAESPLDPEQIREIEAHQRRLAKMRAWSAANGIVLSTAPGVGDSGVLITRVASNTPFANAGVMANDRIVAVNGDRVSTDVLFAKAVDRARTDYPDLAIELSLRSPYAQEVHSVWITADPNATVHSLGMGDTRDVVGHDNGGDGDGDAVDEDDKVEEDEASPQPLPPALAPTRCVVCGSRAGPDAQLWLCGGCQRVAYCSRECQVTHWPEHKNGECRRKAGAAATAPDGDGDADDAHEYAYEYAEDDGYDGEQGGGEGSDGDNNGLEGVYDDDVYEGDDGYDYGSGEDNIPYGDRSGDIAVY